MYETIETFVLLLLEVLEIYRIAALANHIQLRFGRLEGKAEDYETPSSFANYVIDRYWFVSIYKR